MATIIMSYGLFCLIGITVTVVFMVNWLGEKLRRK